MKANPDGFFMAALHPDGTRDTIRTLDKDEAVRFFDDRVGEDDAFAMHARIPSRGEHSIENVHGWEENGVIMGHNMTLTSVDDFMKESDWTGTDSEFFFRKIFMPIYRGLGDSAYRDGKLDPCLDMVVRTYIGYSNKLMFIMPDNRVLRYGQWVNEPDRKEGDKIAFWASNTTYKVHERKWPAATTEGKLPPQRSADSFDDYDYDYDGWYGDVYGRKPASRARSSSFSSLKQLEYDGKYLRANVGDALVAKIGVLLHVLANVVSMRRISMYELGLGKDTAAAASQVVADILETVCDTTVAELADICEGTDSKTPPGSPEQMEAWLSGWAAVLEEALETEGRTYAIRYYHVTAATLRKSAEDLAKNAEAALAALGAVVDFSKEDPDEAIRAYVPAVSRRGYLTAARVRLSDLITPPDMTDEGAKAAMAAAIAFVREAEKEGK